MYNYKNLLWAKSVTRDSGHSWAYMQYNAGVSFFLHWSSRWKGNILKARPGEIILLFQTIKNAAQKSSNGTYVTHLVTPIDNKLREDPLNRKHPFGRYVGVISRPESPKLKPGEFSFLEPNRGAVCSIDTIKMRSKLGKDISLQEKQRIIWKLFPKTDYSIDTIYNNLPLIFEEDWEDFSASEGELKFKLALHKYFERNPELVNAAKAKAKKEGRLRCEACSFDFEKVYPDLGSGYIECHHKNPIATSGIRNNKIQDLALVCSNCHKMLHRKFGEDFLTVEQLKSRFF